MTVNVYVPALPMIAGTTYTFPFALLSQADPKIFKASPSAFQAADFVLFRKTAGTWSRIGNLSTTPALIGISTRVLLMTILDTEIPAGTQAMAVLCNDAADAEWCDLLIIKDIDAPASVGTSDLTLANITGSALFAGITSLANWLRGLYRKDAMNAVAKVEVNSGGGAYDEATDSQEALRDNIGTGGAALNALPNVTVGDLVQAALAKFANTDTGEVAAVPGSVAQLSQGIAPATVAVGSLTQAALAQFANTDTGEVAAASGSVAELAQCNAAGFPAGAIEYTYTVTTPTLVPVEGAAVWISTNLAGTNIIWRGETDTFGVARDALNKKPWLDAGAYYFWVQRSGYSPSNPDLEIVS